MFVCGYFFFFDAVWCKRPRWTCDSRLSLSPLVLELCTSGTLDVRVLIRHTRAAGNTWLWHTLIFMLSHKQHKPKSFEWKRIITFLPGCNHAGLSDGLCHSEECLVHSFLVSLVFSVCAPWVTLKSKKSTIIPSCTSIIRELFWQVHSHYIRRSHSPSTWTLSKGIASIT